MQRRPSKNSPDDELKGKIAKLDDKIKDDGEAAGHRRSTRPVAAAAARRRRSDTGGTPTNADPEPATRPAAPNPASRRPAPPAAAAVRGRSAADAEPVRGRPRRSTTTRGRSASICYGGGGADRPDELLRHRRPAAFRIKGDYMLNPAQRARRAGLPPVHAPRRGHDAADAAVDTLDIVDVGVAAYKHLCPRGARGCASRRSSASQLALMSPAGSMRRRRQPGVQLRRARRARSKLALHVRVRHALRARARRSARRRTSTRRCSSAPSDATR